MRDSSHGINLLFCEPGRQYLVYGRGLNAPVTLKTEGAAPAWQWQQFNPRTGRFKNLDGRITDSKFTYQPGDEQDWVFFLKARTKP